MDDRITSALCEFAGLDMTPEERDRFANQLGDVLDFVERLFEVDTSDVGPIQQLDPRWT